MPSIPGPPIIESVAFGELAIFPRQAEAPIKEALDFLTDTMISHNGKEDRIQLRSKPRQSFVYKIPVQAWDMAAFFNVGYGAIRQKWAVPLWTEAQYIGSVASGIQHVVCNTGLYDFRDNSLALLFTGCGDYQLVEITMVEPDRINIVAGVRKMTEAWLAPVRLGWIAGNITRETSGYNAKYSIAYEIEDNPELEPIEPPQFDGHDIYFEPGLLSGGKLSRTIEKQLDVADFDLGPVAYRSPWLNSRHATPYRTILEGPAEIHAHKQWLFRRMGKFRAFWMPTFEHNLNIRNTGNIVATLLIDSDFYMAYGQGRKHIAIETLDGVWHARTVSNALQMNDETVQLTLAAPLNIQSNNIARASYLGLHRLDADKIELQWIGGGVVESNVRILEISP